MRALIWMARAIGRGLGLGEAAGRGLLAHASDPLRLLVGGVAVEGAGRRELAEFVADHVLGHQHRDEFVAVVDAEGEADELREDGRAPRPGLDDLVAARSRATSPPSSADSRRRTAPSKPSVPRASPSISARRRRTMIAVGRLVVPRLLALGRLAPRRHRMAPAARCGLRRRHADDRPGSSPRRAPTGAGRASGCGRPCRSRCSAGRGSRPRRSSPCIRRAPCAPRPRTSRSSA